MTDEITVNPLKKMFMSFFSTKNAFAAFITAIVLTQPTNAEEQQWWFDVEVILFERNFEVTNLSEKFKQSRLKKPASDVLDLMTPYLKPDLSYLRAGLPYCRASNRLRVKTQYEQGFALPLPLPVAKKNDSSSPQTDKQLEQQTIENLAGELDEVTEENFQYQITTTDKVSKPDDTVQLVQTTDAEGVDPVNIKSVSKSTLPTPSIEVEFIEWQMPSEFLCAYAEQITPSFASIVALQNKVSSASPSDKIKRVPEIINGHEWQQNSGPFMLPTSTMYMSELYEKIKRQPDITPILHINWRQEVKFGREDGQTFRLFAGENFAEQFDANGLPFVNETDSLLDTLNQPTDAFYIPEQELAGLTQQQQQALLVSINGKAPEVVSEDLFAKIAAALADDTPINFIQTNILTEQQTTTTELSIFKEIWRLDGGITVYLRNVGRVPYLHIDSNLDFRQPIYDSNKAQELEGLSTHSSQQGAMVANPLQQPNFLQSVNFNQLRRVISKQVHYFDHPLFGMIVRINRYRWPEPEPEPEAGINNSELLIQ
jgi:hypothetical protein